MGYYGSDFLTEEERYEEEMNEEYYYYCMMEEEYNASKREWKNYGDKDFAEHGGVLIAQSYNAEEIEKYPQFKNDYTFVTVEPLDGDYRKLAVTGSIDITDFEKSRTEISETVGRVIESDADFACAIVENYGGQQLNGKPLTDKPIAVEHGESPFLITKQELYEWLNDVGFEIQNVELEEVMSMDSGTLADYIEQYMYEQGEYDYKADEKIRWIDKDGDRANTTDNIIKSINSDDIHSLIEYLSSDISSLSAADENIEKVPMYVKALRNISGQKYFSKNKNFDAIDR